MNVLAPDNLRELCVALRGGRLACDDELISAIEADLEQYHLAPVTQVPPPHLAEALPLLGWLIHEAARGTTDPGLIVRAADAARAMPWPEYAVRALGAFPALAAAAGADALAVHLEARNRHASFLAYHRSREPDDHDPHLRALDEMLVHLVLAETDTACRTAEQIIDRWAEDFGPEDADEYARLIFAEMASAADIGEQALAAAARVQRRHGFVDAVCEAGMALPESLVHTGIMTARALLLMLALHPQGHAGDTRERLRERFDHAYGFIEPPIEGAAGRDPAPRADLRPAIVRVRLGAALLMPGRSLPSSLTFAPCLAHPVLDDAAVEAMGAWLAEAPAFGGATMPAFIEGVEACRTAFGGKRGYAEWRALWGN